MIMLQVHDEPLFEVPDVKAETTAKTARAMMEGAAHPAAPDFKSKN